jgi:hypothetical protein
MADPPRLDPDLEWLDLVRPVGLVVAPSLLKELPLSPELQTRTDNAAVAELLSPEDEGGPALSDPWAFAERILGWPVARVAGAPGGPALPDDLCKVLPEYDTVLEPHWALAGLDGGWQLLVRIEAPAIAPDTRGGLAGWEATPHQRFERLLRETGIPIGVLISDKELRLVYAPRGETSGWIAFPLRPLATVAGRPMLGGLKLTLGSFRLFNDAEDRRLPALLKASREAQAAVSTALAEQVVGALHELLRGLAAAEPELIRKLATERPHHLYEGLLTVLMRLVFVLYAEDRDLIPSRIDAKARAFYDQGYSARGLHGKLLEDQARHPDTMEERLGAWGRLIALFRLVHAGDRTGWVRARGGKLFDPDAFPFLEGRAIPEEAPRIAQVTDGCVLRVLDGLLTLKGERLSYRTLDVEQIGSVYETVMGFTVLRATGPVLAIRAGRHNRTPVFVDLAELAALKPDERLKRLKEGAQRSGQLSPKQQQAIKAAAGAEGMAAALDSIVDERGSPDKRVMPAGTPILQPTDERRRTGSHYTPRSLTEPIVHYALEPAFERLGPEARPEDVLDLKVCDPAMGSGAFLVEACRALAARLVQAWARWPDARRKLPADEDEDLHARRLVAQRCLYGVDKNPMATDLSKLSLWLATLARDHEFTFLDHALKTGDSLVGLTRAQIAAVHWDTSKPGLPLFRTLIRDRFEAALTGRAEIRDAPDDVERSIQEARYQQIERRLSDARLLGDAVVAAFFSADKLKVREAKRQEIESWLNEPAEAMWLKVGALAGTLGDGETPIPPFHWELEFPEVLGRDNPGFDAVVSNPPFLGGRRISIVLGFNYNYWLELVQGGASRNADLVAHFFRRVFWLLRYDGVFGLLATNTIGQGDTRATGLEDILSSDGSILRAEKRLEWPGEATVIVSVVHVAKGPARSPVLNGRPVSRISAYLVEGNRDGAPMMLAVNAKKAFQGSIILGMGFTFDDVAAANGRTESLDTMRTLIAQNPRNADRIFPYLGGQEVNTSPTQAHHRYVIDFFDRPLRRDPHLKAWTSMDERERSKCHVTGVVSADYPDEVAEDWPDLIEIVRRRVKPERDEQKRDPLRIRWWQYADKRPGLYAAIAPLEKIQSILFVSEHLAVAILPSSIIFANTLNIFSLPLFPGFAVLQTRVHEVWARSNSSTMGDGLRYTPTDCFETFPLPADFEMDAAIATAGQVYHDHRAALMAARNDGMTQTYNRFHDRHKTAADIARLRELHAEMDRAVLRAYHWDDLAGGAEPRFLDETNEDDHTYQGRLFWPAEFRDEVLARLLALNAERAAAERGAEPPSSRAQPKKNSTRLAELKLPQGATADDDD